MADTRQTRTRAKRPAGRSVRITGRKLADTAPPVVHAAYDLDPRDHVRPIVAMLASSEQQQKTLLEIAQPFLDDIRGLSSLVGSGTNQLCQIIQQVHDRMQLRGVAPSARFRLIQRISSVEHNGYPLHRTLLVTFNRERDGVTAQLREVGDVLKIQGLGIDENHALRDLERQFERLVQTRVRIPPHAQNPADRPVVAIVNHLVDWEQFERENPAPRLLWGRIASRGRSPRPTVYWLVGPDGLREQTGVLPRRLTSPYFLPLNNGDWFRAVILDYPDHVEWIDPPTRCPDPNDPEVRKRAWEAIPRIAADKPDVWPLKGM